MICVWTRYDEESLVMQTTYSVVRVEAALSQLREYLMMLNHTCLDTEIIFVCFSNFVK